MDGDHILAVYEALAGASQQMVEAAVREEWDRLIALEQDFSAVFSHLIAIEDNASRSCDYQQRKAALLGSMLESDAQIRLCVNSRLTSLWRLIDGKPKVDRLDAAYGS